MFRPHAHPVDWNDPADYHYSVRTFRIIIIVVAVAVLGATVFLLRPRDRKPRFVFLICLDAVRPDHLSCYGYSYNTTPRIDELAQGGAQFLDAVTQAPWTLPSVATVLSSTFPCQHGARRTEGTQVAYGGVPNNFVETLRAQGFDTGLFTGGLTLESKVPAPELSDAALKWVKGRLDKKCLVVIHHYDTHSPYVADPRCVEELDPGYQGRFMYRFGDFEMLRKARVGRLAEVISLSDRELHHIKALYDCQIMRGDASVGMIADSLRAWDLLDKSMIIVFADHGEEFLEHGSIDHGQTVYEETIRVPLIVYCPSLIHGPVRVARQVGLIDLAPTILDAVGIDKPAYFEGMSLMPLVSRHFRASGETLRPCGLPTSCLITESIARRTEKKALRRPPWKLIYDPFFGAVELYNISEDHSDSDNLIETEPRIAARLTDTLLVMQKYYPGGWCVAWRGPEGARIGGVVRVDGKMLEVVGHDIYPEIDSETDSLAIADDWGSVRFATQTDSGWQGIEVRVDRAMDAEIDMRIGGRRPGNVRIGHGDKASGLPSRLSAADAVVDRKLLSTLFQDPGVDCVVFWLEPGSEPTARQKSQTELRRQLKSIGYIEG